MTLIISSQLDQPRATAKKKSNLLPNLSVEGILLLMLSRKGGFYYLNVFFFQENIAGDEDILKGDRIIKPSTSAEDICCC